MKTVGIVTFFNAANYGVQLQALATQMLFDSLNCSTELINYTNPYEQRILRWAYKENNKMYGYVTSFMKNVLFGKKRNYRKAFDTKRYFHLSSEKCSSADQIEGERYDVLVAGSDQIWNTSITNGYDPAFLLEFGGNSKRISLASSVGSTVLTTEEKQRFGNAFQRFDAISVREEFAKEQLQPYTKKDIHILLDPTLLVPTEKWRSLLGAEATQKPNEKYILTYFVASDKKRYTEYVRHLAAEMGLPVMNIQYNNFNFPYADRKLTGVTLSDFICLIDHAELVITDSFHGTAFSVNLSTPMIVMNHSKNPIRSKSLLEKVGLQDRIEPSDKDALSAVPFDEVQNKLLALRQESLDWLTGALYENDNTETH